MLYMTDESVEELLISKKVYHWDKLITLSVKLKFYLFSFWFIHGPVIMPVHLLLQSVFPSDPEEIFSIKLPCLIRLTNSRFLFVLALALFLSCLICSVLSPLLDFVGLWACSFIFWCVIKSSLSSHQTVYIIMT